MAHPELSAAKLSKETFLQKITSADNTTTTGGETLKIAKSGEAILSFLLVHQSLIYDEAPTSREES